MLHRDVPFRLSFRWLVRPRTRVKHWCLGKFAKWLVRRAGMDTPYALTIEGWDEYYAQFKQQAPFTYYFVESVIPSIQNICYLPSDIFHGIRIYYDNAIKNKVHYLKTGLPVGVWYDTDMRLLCGSMNSLVDYVEIELAHIYTFTNDDPNIRADFYHYGRSEAGGKRWLQEQIDEEYTCEVSFSDNDENAKEWKEQDERSFHERKDIYKDMQEIYLWWKEYFKKAIMDYEIEIDQELEDKYLKRLIELRHYMWT